MGYGGLYKRGPGLGQCVRVRLHWTQRVAVRLRELHAWLACTHVAVCPHCERHVHECVWCLCGAFLVVVCVCAYERVLPAHPGQGSACPWRHGLLVFK